ncbi:MAG: PA14 domain-containing protein [bacterium]|nr:PA14 domain-containing protein [bacterium]
MNRTRTLKVLAVCTVWGLGFGLYAEEAEPVWGRVLGVYCQHDTKSGSPEFPFYSQKQINPNSISTSANAAVPDTSALDPAEVASLPRDAFTYTGYVSEESSVFTTFKTPAVFTPGATYRMNIYLNEPYQVNTRSQFVEINGERVKDAMGQDLVVDPSNIDFSGTKVAKKVWKFVVSNVVASADGTISWGFPRNKNKSAMNVVTFDGTALPATPALSAAANAASVSLSWTPCTDTLAYLVERQDASGTWTTIARTHETSYEDAGLAAKDNAYRVVASNEIGVAVSNIFSTRSKRSLYALHLGPAGRVYGRFVPAASFLSGKFKPRMLPKDPVDVPLELANCGDLPRYFSYFDSSLTFVFSNLTANATHDLRFWMVEPYEQISSSSNPDAYRRVSISVNDEVVTNNVSVWALSGHVNHKPVPVDFTGTATAEGVLAVRIAKVSDKGTCIGLELFALAGAQEDAPPLKAYGAPECVRLVADERSAEMNYDFQYRDSATGEPIDFLHDVPGWSAYDATLAAGQSREYRARVAHPVNPGPWSDWVSATRGGRSPYVPLRVNHTRHTATMQNPPEGWVDGEPYLTSVHASSSLSSTAYATVPVDLSRVQDPAPEAVYRTQFYTSDSKDVRFSFPNFDPACEYRVRVHMMETWADAKAGTRTFALGLDGAIAPEHEKLDVFVAAGSNHNTAVVWELKTRPALDGTIRLDVFHGTQNATIRGTEIVPLGVPVRFDGLVKTAWYANATNVNAIEEECVAESSHTGWSWTAADVPAACTETQARLMARGRFYVPVEGVYAFQVAANGLVRLWLDGSTNLLEQTSASTSNPVSKTEINLSSGAHELIFEYLQGEGADFAAAVTWTSPAGMLGDLKNYTSSVDAMPRQPSGWKSRQMGSRSVPSYVFASDAGTGAYRLSGSGQDLWGGTCDGTFLYRELTGLFEVKMRICNRGGIYAPNTRFGMVVRSTLGPLDASDFFLYSGVSGDEEGKMVLKGYEDVDSQAGSAIVGWGLNTVPMAKPDLPVWMKFTRDFCPTGGHRYVCAFSNDNENWYFARTQDVQRVNSVFVGPWVTGHYSVKGTLAWMEVDNLSVVDTTPRGTMLFFR